MDTQGAVPESAVKWVRKRDGTVVPFDATKIADAVGKALRATGDDDRFVADELVSLLETLQRACPPQHDPVLANRSPVDRRLPRAGLSLYKARVYSFHGSWNEAEQAWADFVHDWLAREE